MVSPSGPLLFGLAGSGDFARAVASELGVALCPHEEREFEDGEHKARALASVRGRDVYVIHSLYGEPGASPNDKLLRLLFFIGSLRDAAAARITAVVPYLAYARKDQRSKSRDPVTTRYVATFFEAAGTDCVVTVDVHNLAAFENAYRCACVNLEAGPLLAERCAHLIGERAVTVVSPDAGGIKRADRFRTRLGERLGRPVGAAFAEKYRSEGTLRGEALVGEVRGRVAIVVDDLVSAGHTIDRAARACVAHGATAVYAAATHGVFTPEADAVLAASPLERILVTDTVGDGRLSNPTLRDRVERLGIAPLVAEAIGRLNAGGSLVELAR